MIAWFDDERPMGEIEGLKGKYPLASKGVTVTPNWKPVSEETLAAFLVPPGYEGPVWAMAVVTESGIPYTFQTTSIPPWGSGSHLELSLPGMKVRVTVIQIRPPDQGGTTLFGVKIP